MAVNRIEWIDRWKGLLIFLVVLGHAVGSASHLALGPTKALYEYVYKAIYYFHMPAFFWIVGLCWHAHPEGLWKFARNRYVRLVLPYFIFGLASIVAYQLVGGVVISHSAPTDGYYARFQIGSWGQMLLSLLHGGGWPHGEGFRCNSVLWFLPALFSVNCVYSLLDRYLSRTGQVVLLAPLCLLSFCLARWDVALPWGLSLVPRYLSFVVLGRWMRLPETPSSRKSKAVWGLSLLVYCILVAVLPNRYLGTADIWWFLLTLPMPIAGIYLSATGIRLSPLSLCKTEASWGACSLGIMLIHKFILVGLLFKLPICTLAVRQGGVFSVLTVLLLSLVATELCRALSCVPIVRKVLGGS